MQLKCIYIYTIKTQLKCIYIYTSGPQPGVHAPLEGAMCFSRGFTRQGLGVNFEHF